MLLLVLLLLPLSMLGWADEDSRFRAAEAMKDSHAKSVEGMKSRMRDLVSMCPAVVGQAGGQGDLLQGGGHAGAQARPVEHCR